MNPAFVVIPLLVLEVAFVVSCEVDLWRAEEVRYLPRWVWAILCLNVLGGLVYLAVGRVDGPRQYARGYRAAPAPGR